MIKHIDKDVLRRFLLDTIKELSVAKGFPMEKDFKFRITPNQESDKKHDSTDDLMRLVIYTAKNIKGKEFDLDTTIQMLSAAPHSKYPLWINISMVEENRKNILFDVETSLRFRLPKTLSNQETEHPPFKAIK